MVFLVGIVSSEDVSYCCEKTVDGAWCQNSPMDKCDSAFQKAPTACESTSYCKMGCCFDSKEGQCWPNTAKKTCEQQNGSWNENAKCEIAQCKSGCCILGNQQAAFTTQTACKMLATRYGTNIDFRPNIQSELQCITSVTSDVKGACVYEQDFSKTCKFTTKRDCLSTIGARTNVSFHENSLCSDPTLGTNCAPTKKTTCVEGKSEVYFIDSCGNLANIYDSSKIEDTNYWSRVVTKEDTCDDGTGNKNSRICGNCDYYAGSICKSASAGQVSYGDNVCKSLDCEGHSHGESWCMSNAITGKENNPGAQSYRMMCYNNEITPDLCDPFRNKICIEAEVNGFTTARCVNNRWQTCAAMTSQKDCENADQRDCIWKETVWSVIDCVPKYTPGLDFWKSDLESVSKPTEYCGVANAQCKITYEKGLLSGWKCEKNCECESGKSWENEMMRICSALGDCGSSVNYIGDKGFNNKSDLLVRS